MGARYISVVALLVCVLSGCASRTNQPTSISTSGRPTALPTESPKPAASPTESPRPTVPPTETPKPVTYRYEYEIVDTRTDCGPDLATYAEFLAYSYNPSDKSQADSAAKKAAVIVLCTQNRLQNRLSQRGAAGWKLVAFETLTPAQYDLGIEYTYRLVWERQE